MRRAARVDGNHPEVVAALRAIGASVADTSRVGSGFPDLVVGFRGRNWLVEVKNGRKMPSQRRLTEDQAAFVAGWRGHWIKVESAEEAVSTISRQSLYVADVTA